jgi:hypothetical protein
LRNDDCNRYSGLRLRDERVPSPRDEADVSCFSVSSIGLFVTRPVGACGAPTQR